MKEYPSKELKRCNYLLGELDRAYHEAALKLGLSDSAMKILYAICDEGESCMLQTICIHTGLSKQTVNSALRKLEEESIIYLETVGAKSKRVYLSEKGKQLSEKTALRIMQMEDDIFTSWKKEDVEKYLELLEQFLAALRSRTEHL